ncbi:hypothetical protein FNU79_08685 [Deinococcus detaillensis]|uniref:DUF2808 domain-containing protein n=1 Tax=Deinococcus detaillensis TaxID=2592048 RepID=A0A553V073_9DEIO|nr:hypothetical protein [Deinococcus detaillensis]TSA85852.1 hypothetical protein FNU79_08685 [Deinococcus detaillensis]
MNKPARLWLAALLLTLLPTSAQAATFTVPREKISLVCTDSYFKAIRVDFVLPDEQYSQCKLLLPLALRERWPGRRTFFVIPRVSASLFVKEAGVKDGGKTQWLPLAPLVNPGADPLHLAVDSKGYGHLELVAKFVKLSDLAGEKVPDTLGAGGKLTVCAAPIYAGEAPCVTFDLTARFKVYKR